MPSDPHVFDELRLPFIFVPHGEPEPTEWLSRHRDYIKLPATFVPRGGGDRHADRVAGVHPLPPGSSTGGPAGSSDPGGPAPQAENAAFDATQATPGITSLSSDPIAAHRMANSALETAASSFASGRPIRPDVSLASATTDAATASNWLRTDATSTEDQAAPGPGSHDPNQQEALSVFERMFISSDMAANAKSVLSNLTNGAFSSSQIDEIYDEVIRHITFDQAGKFASINPSSRPIILTPEQLDIVQGELDNLTPDVRGQAQEQFKRAVQSGRVICPQCKG